MKISFHGGARGVTGACYLVETAQTKFLVDCGLFQGGDERSDLNVEKFHFDPQSIAAVFVTHAHVDHIGRIPKLVREGFRGRIYSTPPTRELAELLLEDALRLSLHERKELYHEEDLAATLRQWEGVPYHKPIALGDVAVQFNDAGHILGSAMVAVSGEEKQVLFTGDLGNFPSILLPPPENPKDIEYLVIESTYGNREHEAPGERVLMLERAVEDIAARKGTLMIPAFATERTQDILHLFNEMLLYKRIPEMPVFVDSPLAIRATEVYERHAGYYNDEIKELYRNHQNLFKFKKLRFTHSVEESKKINDVSPPKVVIAGSGMMQGGRILHHLRRYLSDPQSMLLVVGFQAVGSLGRRLVDGEKMIKLFGEDIAVQAEIRNISGFSAHADNPQLFSFVTSNADSLKRVFVVQGEESEALHFMQEIRDRLGLEADTPALYQEFSI